MTAAHAARQALRQGQGLAGRDDEGGAGAHRGGQSRLNAFCKVDTEEALRAARASERRWKNGKALSPIDGVPVSIKELVRVKGWPASMGSKLTDKTPVRCRRAGGGAAARGGRDRVRAEHQLGVRPQGRDRHAAERRHAQSVEHRHDAGRLVGRRGRGGRGRPRAARHRHRRRRLGAHPVELQRADRPQGDLRPRAQLAADPERRFLQHRPDVPHRARLSR